MDKKLIETLLQIPAVIMFVGWLIWFVYMIIQIVEIVHAKNPTHLYLFICVLVGIVMFVFGSYIKATQQK